MRECVQHEHEAPTMPMAKKHLLRTRSETGQATVEFALILPVLLFMIIVMLDLGKAYNYWIDETHLANAAARWAVVNKSPVAGQSIETALQNEADSAQLRSGVTVSICFPNGTSNVAVDPVQAKVTYVYKPLKFLTGPFAGAFKNLGNVTIVSKATMLLEQPYDSVTLSNNSYTPVAC
jgi:Flp pilus assembly protein TadG